MIRAVLDTNIILAAQRASSPTSPNREIFQRWAQGEFVLLYSRDILDEYSEIMRRHGVDSETARLIIKRILQAGEPIEVDFFHLPKYPIDPDDVIFILVALNGDASALVSYDDHLLSLDGAYSSLRITKPLAFLAQLDQKP